ncbi:hypothetical protein Rhe02_58310 [Rhizocola hellebori]|uniref:Uncharacterized protein n=1 Tax=Rhizocola hellebori TaxID=1392758 RepID=A0A8J3VHT9_9ACTN|nr:hypothetical protein [Rhizocola hellebori]GIH07764.1 hypothetical protein Rhe02_58310 [Rhizocola hellebori]
MTQPAAGYGFLPWVRAGLAGSIARVDGDPAAAPRAAVTVSVTVDAGGDPRPVPVTLTLSGPGEIAALDPRAILRVAPRPGEVDAEPNELPLVEFADPDLPWRYTPAVADSAGRLRPWLVLAVVTADEITAEEHAGADGRLPAVTIASADALPRLDQSWAWAHAHIDGFSPAAGETLASVAAHRQRSRLLAGRHLLPKTAYTAMLVPAFERGRLAGLREPIADTVDGLAAAWAPDDLGIRLPVYYRWSFQTGVQADFEQLARRLTARPAGPRIGLTPLDVSTPDPALPPAASTPLVLTGALVSPTATVGAWADTEREAFVPALAAMLNQPADAISAGADPIVAPPLWGRWQAAADRLDPAPAATPAWFHELNADPRLRTIAGLGAEVVRRHDQELMAEAWRQVDGVIAANETLRRAQLAREAARKLYDNHLTALGTETLLTVTAPVHSQILLPASPGVAAAAPLTTARRLGLSPIPDGAMDGRIRRAQRTVATAARRAARVAAPIRPGGRAAAIATGTPMAGGGGPAVGRVPVGRLGRFIGVAAVPGALRPPRAGEPSATAPAGLLARLNNGELRTRPVPLRPDGMVVTALPFRAPSLTTFAPPPGGFALPGMLLRSAPPPGDGQPHGGPAGGGALPGGPVGGGHGAVRPARPAGGPWLPPVGTDPVPAVGWVPGVAGHVLGVPGGSVTPVPVSTDSQVVLHTGALFGQAAIELAAVAGTAAAPGPVLSPVNLTSVAATLTEQLHPERTITDSIRGRLQLAPWITWAASDPLEQVMAAPEFDAPMYAPLRELGHDWLLPGAGGIPADTVTVVCPNQRFIEAYLLGLSHEMGRELLFHEYPTDQRGTYFRQFWDTSGALTPAGIAADPESLVDITPIPLWQRLGANTGRVPPPAEGELVLLVKGELLSRFPDTIVSAVAAVQGTDGRRTLGTDTRYPVFTGRLEPDIAFFGFDLTTTMARGDGTQLGWFFVLAEHPTAPRFGLDADDGAYGARATAWADVSWAQLAEDADALAALRYVDVTAALPDAAGIVPGSADPPITWGANGSDQAWIMLRRPFRVAIHGADLIVEEP